VIERSPKGKEMPEKEKTRTDFEKGKKTTRKIEKEEYRKNERKG